MSHVIMRCALAARSLVAVLVVLSVPAVAFADGIFTPFAGVSFGGDQTERVPTYGVSLAGMAGGVLGFELDVAQTAEAMTGTVFDANTKITTFNGNLIVGVPLGAVRPYVIGGLGWLRTSLTADGQSGSMQSVTSDGLGVAVGGGLMGFFSDQRWTPSFGQLSGQVKVDSRFMFLSRFRLR